MTENPRDCWRTPRWLFEWLDDRFGDFGLDAYADADNALCQAFNFEGKSRWAWAEVPAVFANPPFRLAADAMRNASEAWKEARTISTLILPAAPNSARWHRHRHECLTLWPTRRIQFDPPPGVDEHSSNRGDIAIHVFGEMVGEASVDFSGVAP